jgi:hypothetical protein
MNTWSLVANASTEPAWAEKDKANQLADDLNRLHINRRNSRPRDASEHGSPGFAGGFANPRDKALPLTPPGAQAAFTSPHHPHGGGFAIPKPNGSPSPAMPMPVPMLPGHHQNESRTMRYARTGYGMPEIPTGGPSLPVPQLARTDRVHSAPPMPQAAHILDVGSSSDEVEIISFTPSPKYPGRKNSNSDKPLTISSPPKSSSRRKSDPITPTKRRTSVTSPAGTPGTPGTPGGSKGVQCSGTTLQGERCKKRVVAKRPALATKLSTSASDSSDSEEDTIELYCGTHAAQIAKDTVYFAQNQKRVQYEDYIPSYLSPETKVALRVEMRKSPSAKDADGYIYAFHIQDDDTPELAHLKVGRTNNIGKRMNQWGRQCGSREQILRGVWPSPAGGVDGADLVKGRMKPPPAGPYMARLERLVHLELADLVANRQYLHKKWSDMCSLDFETAAVPVNERKAKSDEKCKDCKLDM